MIMIREDHLHTIEKGMVQKIEPCGTPYFNDPASKKKHYQYKPKNFLFGR